MAGEIQLNSISFATESSGTITVKNSKLDTDAVFPTFVGLILPFAYDTSGSPPTGFLECKGAAVSRSTYSDLFAVIGTTWGAGDGSSTFNLPDLQGAFSINSRNKVGPSVGSFQEDRFQGHGHNIRGDESGSGANPKLFNSAGGDNSGVIDIQEAMPPGDSGYFEHDSNGTPRHGSDTRPYNAGVMYCIKY